MESLSELDSKIMARTQSYLKSVDLIVLLLAAPHPHPFDLELLSLVRKAASHIPRILAVNKIDNKENIAEALLPFYEAKFQDLIALSARGRSNLNLLLEEITKKLGQAEPAPTKSFSDRKIEKKQKVSSISEEENLRNTSDEIPLAIIGRPNAGKSSLFNSLLGEERALVSEIPGTTRDSLDSRICYKEKHICLIDTAGMRKSSRLLGIKNKVDFYSISRTKASMRRARIVILLADGAMGLTDFDKRICSMAQKYKCALVFAISKWDLIKEKYTEKGALKDHQERIQFLFPHLRDLHTLYCSALTGMGIRALLDTVLDLDKNMKLEVPTSKLNSLLQKWSRAMPRSASKLKIFYATQNSKAPPEFIVFVNDPRFFSNSLSSYFMNCMRKEFPLKSIPFALHARKRV